MIKFLIDLAVVHTLFYFIWNYLFTFPIVAIFTILKSETWGVRLSKGLGAIVFSSLSAIVVIGHKSGVTSLIIFSLIAGIFLLFNMISGTTESRDSIRQEYDVWQRLKLEQELEHDYIYWLIAIIFFIITLFIPAIGVNPINKIFFFLIDWVMDIKVVNWIIMGISCLLLLSFIWKGFFGLMMAIALRKSRSNQD